MKLYFCGSVRGDANHKEFYKQIIPWLEREYGEVLDRSIIDDDPLELGSTVKYSDDLDEQVFLCDYNRITNADVVIADITAPSFGVGAEIIIAVKILRKPLLAIYKEGTTTSEYIKGAVKVHGGIISAYLDTDDAKRVVRHFLGE